MRLGLEVAEEVFVVNSGQRRQVITPIPNAASAFVKLASVRRVSAGTWASYPLYFQGISSFWMKLDETG